MNFTLNVGGTLNLGDALDFVTTAASNDANFQKSLLFGPLYTPSGWGDLPPPVDSTGSAY